MSLRVAASLLLLITPLRAQDLAELLEALSGTAANFASTAPGLAADETLDQRGRRGFIEILKGKVPTLKNSDIYLPEQFSEHHMKSRYSLTTALHENRSAVEIDGLNTNGLRGSDTRQIRHAMSMGVDDTRRQDLEDLENDRLEGAVTDFGPLIVLFSQKHLAEYSFSLAAPDKIGEEPVLVINYRQTAGNQGLTVFEKRTAEREQVSGTVWFRERDLLPLRITMTTHKALAKSFSVETEASVDYMPSKYGLVPASVSHREYLNMRLLVENDLHYSNYRHTGPELIP
jgi:hypothetical protein